MRNLILVNMLFASILSCKSKDESSSNESYAIMDSAQNVQSISAWDTSVRDSAILVSPSNIHAVLDRMNKHVNLLEADYLIISEFLFRNNDESLSEETGYTIYQYLRNNEKRNAAFLTFLNTKDKMYKEKVLSSLIEIMCIDLGDDSYNYDKLIKDFSIFKGSTSAKKTFETCMANQVN